MSATPSQSRTTMSPTPPPPGLPPRNVPTDTISEAHTSYLDDLASGAPTGVGSDAPFATSVVPLDGHQTIVAKYEDFLEDASLPAPPPPASSPGGSGGSSSVPPTTDLGDDDAGFLFTP